MNLIFKLKSGLIKSPVYIIAFIYATNLLAASNVDTLFTSDEIIYMELRSDFSKIQEERTQNPEYHNGELIYYTSGNESIKVSVRVMARGNFRLNPENCKFPPLFLDFDKDEVGNTIFRSQNRLKLVTPCQFEEDVIDEYTVYKMYNQVTDISLKVRLVKILFFDTDLNKKIFTRHSFFIEDKEHAAERNIAVAKDRVLTPFDLNKDNFQKLAVFQYLIGNKDWFITSRKNIVVFQPRDTTIGLYAVPYDFDFSGFVNAEYSKPRGVPEDLLVERREYKGLCYTEAEFNEIFEFYKGLRPVFESIISNQKLISRYNRIQIIRYMDIFYSILEDKELIKRAFLDVCQTRKDYNMSYYPKLRFQMY
jgi:hypothetical protein